MKMLKWIEWLLVSENITGGRSKGTQNMCTTITQQLLTPQRYLFLKVICHFSINTNNPGGMSPEVVDGSYINAIASRPQMPKIWSNFAQRTPAVLDFPLGGRSRETGGVNGGGKGANGGGGGNGIDVLTQRSVVSTAGNSSIHFVSHIRKLMFKLPKCLGLPAIDWIYL